MTVAEVDSAETAVLAAMTAFVETTVELIDWFEASIVWAMTASVETTVELADSVEAVAVAIAAFVEHSLADWIALLPFLFFSEDLPMVNIAGAEPVHAVGFVAVSAASFAAATAVAELYTFAAAL